MQQTMFNSVKKGKAGRVGSVNDIGSCEAKVVAEAKKQVHRVLKDILGVAKKLGEEEAKVKVSIAAERFLSIASLAAVSSGHSAAFP